MRPRGEAWAGRCGRFFAERRDLTKKTRGMFCTGQEPSWKEAHVAPLRGQVARAPRGESCAGGQPDGPLPGILEGPRGGSHLPYHKHSADAPGRRRTGWLKLVAGRRPHSWHSGHLRKAGFEKSHCGRWALGWGLHQGPRRRVLALGGVLSGSRGHSGRGGSQESVWRRGRPYLVTSASRGAGVSCGLHSDTVFWLLRQDYEFPLISS